MSFISTRDPKTNKIIVKYIDDGRKADITALINFYVNRLDELLKEERKEENNE